MNLLLHYLALMKVKTLSELGTFLLLLSMAISILLLSILVVRKCILIDQTDKQETITITIQQ